MTLFAGRCAFSGLVIDGSSRVSGFMPRQVLPLLIQYRNRGKVPASVFGCYWFRHRFFGDDRISSTRSVSSTTDLDRGHWDRRKRPPRVRGSGQHL
jgi:hypothetical protein